MWFLVPLFWGLLFVRSANRSNRMLPFGLASQRYLLWLVRDMQTMPLIFNSENSFFTSHLIVRKLYFHASNTFFYVSIYVMIFVRTWLENFHKEISGTGVPVRSLARRREEI